MADGLDVAVNYISWRNNPKATTTRYLVVLTQGEYRDNCLCGLDVTTLATKLNDKNIRVILPQMKDQQLDKVTKLFTNQVKNCVKIENDGFLAGEFASMITKKVIADIHEPAAAINARYRF